MVTYNITDEIAEEGSVGFVFTFTDENGDSMVPGAIAWTLTSDGGTVINSRENVSVDTPAASTTIILSGDDLAIGTNGTRRKILLAYTYTSDLGNDLPGRFEASFQIRNLTAVT